MPKQLSINAEGIIRNEHGICIDDNCPCQGAVCNVCIDLDAPATIAGMFSGIALTSIQCSNSWGSLAWYLTHGFEIPFWPEAMTGNDCYWHGNTGFPTGFANQSHEVIIRYSNLFGLPIVNWNLNYLGPGFGDVTNMGAGTLSVSAVDGLIDCFAPRSIDGLLDCFPFDQVLTLNIN